MACRRRSGPHWSACALSSPRSRRRLRRASARRAGVHLRGAPASWVPGREEPPKRLPVQPRGDRERQGSSRGLRALEGNDPLHARKPRAREGPGGRRSGPAARDHDKPATRGRPRRRSRCRPWISTRTGLPGGMCRWMIGDMRLGIADHLGWAVAVTASADHEVVDRRRIELVEPGISPAPIHYESRRLDVAATGALVAKVRASVARATSAALDEIANASPAPVLSISLRAWPLDFPDDIAVQRRAPYEARADAIMYRQELSELASARGWEVHLYDAKAVVGQAVSMLAERADEVLHGPRAALGPPWTKDHRTALAATIVAG